MNSADSAVRCLMLLYFLWLLLLPGVLCLYSFSGIFFKNGFVVVPSLAPRQLTLQSLGCGFAFGLPLSWEYCPLRPSLTGRGFFSPLWAGPRLFHLPQGGPNLNLHLSRWPNILTADASMRGFWAAPWLWDSWTPAHRRLELAFLLTWHKDRWNRRRFES